LLAHVFGLPRDERIKMAHKTKPKPDNAEQSKRFIETAEEVGADDEQVLDRAFKKIISSPKKGKEGSK
jgi:hypothetical protein